MNAAAQTWDASDPSLAPYQISLKRGIIIFGTPSRRAKIPATGRQPATGNRQLQIQHHRHRLSIKGYGAETHPLVPLCGVIIAVYTEGDLPVSASP